MSLESEQSSPTLSDEPEPKRQARDNEVQGIEVPGIPYTIMVYVEGGPVGSAIVTSQKNAPTRQSFLDWPVYYQSFNWGNFSSRDLNTAPPSNIRLTEALMKEVIEHINPTDRANRYKADFDTAGSPRIIRANLGPAAKAELKEDEGD
ncbi:MAG: hypothetical protein FRX48_05284 [Lasallia pustulata]|uniref:Uncharacterized protein n=1 Tax=Lasallia pustulata TaxID=136370 RepID=A0A5M8PND7_9LECA|nr:MAG: hypothetical protein FRX48_05284 [Lasallia pustulata]